MGANLIYRSSRSITFRDDTYRWIDEATFTVIGGATQLSPIDVLQSLIVDDHYVGAYQLADQVASDVRGRERAPTQHQQYLTGLAERGLTPETDPLRTGYPDLWERYNRPGPEHGPYVLSAISTSTFDYLTGPRARQALIDWLTSEEDWDHPPDAQLEGDLDGIIDDLSTSSTVFKLHDVGPQSEHATGWIVQPYFELVAIDIAATQLRLIAAGTD